jgi:hypothetical protein
MNRSIASFDPQLLGQSVCAGDPDSTLREHPGDRQKP